ncbi:hypothetical protein C8J57DRAFT_1287230 [Mycena rebaudengoi]|nr:hypothetical protein C8J57DRAFT_1287230 [Mycena rebaudengoi]
MTPISAWFKLDLSITASVWSRGQVLELLISSKLLEVLRISIRYDPWLLYVHIRPTAESNRPILHCKMQLNSLSLLALAALLPTLVQGQRDPVWGQCGGLGYSRSISLIWDSNRNSLPTLLSYYLAGPTTCDPVSVCVFLTPFFSWCRRVSTATSTGASTTVTVTTTA